MAEEDRLDSFDFTAIPSLNKTLVLELARSEYVTRRENIIAVGNSDHAFSRPGGVSSDPTRNPRGAVHYAIERSISNACGRRPRPAEEGQEGNARLACRNHRVLRP